ncbi:AMIN-like domain-containing (lipo)protein [Geodermatophilus sp. SYSU D01036]
MHRTEPGRTASARGPRTLAALVLLGGLLAGCGGGGGDGTGSDGGATATASPPSPSPSPSPSSSPSPSPSLSPSPDGADGEQDDGAPQPPFPADTAPDTEEASSDASGNVTAIRIGRHDGFDRVVFEFGGTGTPGWDVRYTDDPARQGSGEPVDLAGDATLQVAVTGVGYPPDTGVDEYAGPRRLAARDTEVVTEVYFDGTFEGVTAALVGTESEAPFRVYLLEDPARVVLEVADAP